MSRNGSKGRKEMHMNPGIALNSGRATYLLIPAGLAPISLIIRWGIMLRIAVLVVAIAPGASWVINSRLERKE
jgi:hypothetical protein